MRHNRTVRAFQKFILFTKPKESSCVHIYHGIKSQESVIYSCGLWCAKGTKPVFHCLILSVIVGVNIPKRLLALNRWLRSF